MSGLSVKSSSDLRLSIPKGMGHIGHEMPPRLWSKLRLREGIKNVIKNVTHHPVLQESSSYWRQLLTYSTCWNGFRDPDEALCASRETDRTGPQITGYIQEKFYKLRFLHLPILRKALKLLTKISVPRNNRNLLPQRVLGCSVPPCQTHIYTGLPREFQRVANSSQSF